MCITSPDIRGQQESMAWDLLCEECTVKTERLLNEREGPRLSTPQEAIGPDTKWR